MEVIEDRFRRVSVFDEVSHTRSAVPFAQLLALVIQDQRNMRELRRLGAEGPVELDVLWCVGEVIFAPDDMRDPHLQIVNNVHKVKNPRAVRPPESHVGMGGRI